MRCLPQEHSGGCGHNRMVATPKAQIEDPQQVVLLFNECINNQDLDGMAALMTDDHTFIDRDGAMSQPKSFMLHAWKRFFEMFPHYRNTFSRIESYNDHVAVLGHAYWSPERVRDPVIWTASIVGGKVREWRIHQDTPENRLKLHLV